MSEQHQQATENDGTSDPAAQAFEALREEVARLRVELAERAAAPTPDYTVTLAKILEASQITSRHLHVLAKMPALQLEASGWSHQIAAASEEARRQDHAMLEGARESFQRAAKDLVSGLASAREADNQRQWLLWTGLLGLLAGALLWAVAMGPLLWAAPRSWHWPEHMAAGLMGIDEEEAGAHLIAAAAPDRWRDIVLGYRIVLENRKAIAICERQAESTRKPVSCATLIRNLAQE